MLDDLVYNLHLVVCLRVSQSGIEVFDIKPFTKCVEFGVIKLATVVSDDGIGKSKSTYNILLFEICSLLLDKFVNGSVSTHLVK